MTHQLFPTPEKPVRVEFARHHFWDEETRPTKFMGYISYENMVKIMQAIETYKFGTSKCMYKPCIRYKAQIDEDTDMYNRHVFQVCDSFWGYQKAFPVCGGTEIDKSTAAITSDTKNMVICAKCMRAGKCTDAFMRDTIGAALYGALYAKQKQK